MGSVEDLIVLLLLLLDLLQPGHLSDQSLLLLLLDAVCLLDSLDLLVVFLGE